MGWRVLKVADGEDGVAWAGALVPGWEGAATLLKRGEGTEVWRARLLDRDVVVKVWRLGGAGRLKSVLGVSRGHRHWRGAERLAEFGIATARPLALLRDGRSESLVMEAVNGRTLLQVMDQGGLQVEQEHALARAVGAQVAAFGAAYNRDHKPSNLIVRREGDAPEIAVIDCVAIGDGADAERMFTSLVLEPSGCGCLPRRSLLARALVTYTSDRDRRRTTWRDVERRVREHGDPTPKVNPLAPPPE